jgi:hypothetical protein
MGNFLLQVLSTISGSCAFELIRSTGMLLMFLLVRFDVQI